MSITRWPFDELEIYAIEISISYSHLHIRNGTHTHTHIQTNEKTPIRIYQIYSMYVCISDFRTSKFLCKRKIDWVLLLLLWLWLFFRLVVGHSLKFDIVAAPHHCSIYKWKRIDNRFFSPDFQKQLCNAQHKFQPQVWWNYFSDEKYGN